MTIMEYVGKRKDYWGMQVRIIHAMDRIAFSRYSYVKVRAENGDEFDTTTEWLRPCTKQISGDTEVRKSTTNPWEFQISRESQIDYDKIAQDLSWESPLALVTANGNELVQVVVYAPLFAKANKLGMYSYPGRAMKTKEGNYYLTLDDGKSLPVVKQWAKKVRQAAWADAYKAKVKVQLLEV